MCDVACCVCALQIGREYGTTTGRPRRIGWMDIPALRYVSRINGLNYLNLTKLDVLDKLAEIKVQITQGLHSDTVVRRLGACAPEEA